ncbi:TIGR03085 family protein, partial [Mycobacterium sp. ITM-2017-0098]
AGRGPEIAVIGDPGELLLFAAGREEARVTIDGAPDLIERVKKARGGL